jgi:hypothetical protein
MLIIVNERFSPMARDIAADIDRLTDQLVSLRASLMKQTSSAAEDASSYLAPRARQVARHLRHEGHGLSDAARRNPAVATGALVGVLALGAALGLLFASGRDRA